MKKMNARITVYYDKSETSREDISKSISDILKLGGYNYTITDINQQDDVLIVEFNTSNKTKKIPEKSFRKIENFLEKDMRVMGHAPFISV